MCEGVPEGLSDYVCRWQFCGFRVGQGVLAVGGIGAAVARMGWQMSIFLYG